MKDACGGGMVEFPIDIIPLAGITPPALRLAAITRITVQTAAPAGRLNVLLNPKQR
jgi:hypothetical protein